MADRELLELAAKAAGYEEIIFHNGKDDDGYDNGMWEYTWVRHDGKLIEWNPLTDDGDALRLVVKLNMAIQPCTLVDPPFLPSVECGQYSGDDPNPPEWAEEALGSDPYAATRRAIVRAAAEIGRLME